MTAKSRIDWWFHLLVVAFALYAGGLTVYGTALLFMDGVTRVGMFLLIIGIIGDLIFALLIAPLRWHTLYTFEADALRIQCGFYTLRLPYGDISSAEKVRNAIASLALSTYRIELHFTRNGMKDMIWISPINRTAFLQMLTSKGVPAQK